MTLFSINLLFNNLTFDRILLSLIYKLFIILLRLNCLNLNVHILLLIKSQCLNSNTLHRFSSQTTLTKSALTYLAMLIVLNIYFSTCELSHIFVAVYNLLLGQTCVRHCRITAYFIIYRSIPSE